MRNSVIKRKTNETDIVLELNLDGTGSYEIESGNGFFNHMLELFAKHGMFDLKVKCNGDTDVDFHHSIEDIGICLGKAFTEALGDKKGIERYGDIILPMDEALVLASVDISGRTYLGFEADFLDEYKINDFDLELVEEFMQAFARSAQITLHIKTLRGTNMHHLVEGIFKALARVLKKAVKIDENAKDVLPSSKGVL